mgnify:CR=1 FL=1
MINKKQFKVLFFALILTTLLHGDVLAQFIAPDNYNYRQRSSIRNQHQLAEKLETFLSIALILLSFLSFRLRKSKSYWILVITVLIIFSLLILWKLNLPNNMRPV